MPVVQATGAMFDFTTTRRAALDAVVPPPVVWTLVVVAVFAAASTGYGLAAAGHRHRLASSGLFISVALIMTLIFELDEPRTGLIRVPQAAMERVASAILGAPAPN
jgi:cellobiose-specific phosphotransferase system component IIC